MSHLNDSIALDQIRGSLGLRPQASCAEVVRAVRETKATADLAGAALQVREHFTPDAAPDDDLLIARRGSTF